MRPSPRSLLLLVLAAACDLSPGGPDEGPIPPDDRGTLVTFNEPLAAGVPFVWSADSREVFVSTRRTAGSATSYPLRAYDPVTQVQRVVSEASAYPEGLRASETGQWLYYSSLVSTTRDIFRVAQQGGSPERVTAGGSQSAGFAVSDDTRYVAWVPEPHLVTVLDTRDQTRRDFSVTDAVSVLVMAPDASEIAVISGLTGGQAVDVLTTESGDVRRVHTRQDPSPGSGLASIAVGASWKNDALHLLFMDVDATRHPAFRERNTTTGGETSLGTMSAVDALDVEYVSWAPAASAAVALVAGDCLRSSGFAAPCLRRYEMFVASGGQGRLVGTANLPEFGATVGLSPDGHWLAVGSETGGFSVKQLPP